VTVLELVAALAGAGLLLFQVAAVVFDILTARRCYRGTRLVSRVGAAISVNERVVAVDLLLPHITITPVADLKSVREHTPGALALSDLFNLDSLQATVAWREGWLPVPKLPDPYAPYKLGRMAMFVYPALVCGLGSVAAWGTPVFAIVVGSTSLASWMLAFLSELCRGAAASCNQDTRRTFRVLAETYCRHLGAQPEEGGSPCVMDS
jgi:hypothetical protein